MGGVFLHLPHGWGVPEDPHPFSLLRGFGSAWHQLPISQVSSPRPGPSASASAEGNPAAPVSPPAPALLFQTPVSPGFPSLSSPPSFSPHSGSHFLSPRSQEHPGPPPPTHLHCSPGCWARLSAVQTRGSWVFVPRVPFCLSVSPQKPLQKLSLTWSFVRPRPRLSSPCSSKVPVGPLGRSHLPKSRAHSDNGSRGPTVAGAGPASKAFHTCLVLNPALGCKARHTETETGPPRAARPGTQRPGPPGNRSHGATGVTPKATSERHQQARGLDAQTPLHDQSRVTSIS